MVYVFLGVAVVVVLVVVLGLLSLGSRGTDPPSGGEALPYDKESYFFSKSEKAFYMVLCQAVPVDFSVFPKVRLMDLLAVRAGVENRQKHVNRIVSKHVDFLVCDRDHFEPRLVIELDDASHRQASRRQRDAFVDAACGAAGVAILHVPARSAYDLRVLSEQIGPLLTDGPVGEPRGREAAGATGV